MAGDILQKPTLTRKFQAEMVELGFAQRPCPDVRSAEEAM